MFAIFHRVGARGNGTCQLGRIAPRRQQDLQRDAYYDVYAKGRVSLIGCRTNQGVLSSITQFYRGLNQTTDNAVVKGNGVSALSINGRGFGNTSFFNTFGNSIFSRSRNQSNGNTRVPSSNPFGSSSFSLEPNDDTDIRVFDILQNKKQYDNSFNKFDGLGHVPSLARDDTNSFDFGGDSKGFWIVEDKLNVEEGIDELYGARISPTEDFNNFGTPTTILKKKPSTESDDAAADLNLYTDYGQKINTKPVIGYEAVDYDNLWWDTR